ncbi:MAG: YbaB/EbfC family nucleoid-associated protein [Oscillospiraceae bacterium]|nr:YbaB/EbfC family nucleoid-associated protein [Oscillospiraceae bacterium]
MAKGGFNGGRMSGGMNMNMIKQAQKMQEEMLRRQQEVEEKEFSASAGGGMVTAKVNGKRELVALEIDADAVIEAEVPEDVEMLQDAIIAAINEAMKKAAEEMSGTMAKLTGGLNLGF